MGSPIFDDATIPENTPTKTAGCNLVLTGGGNLASVHKQPPVSSESADEAATTMRWILMDGHFFRRNTMKVLYATLSAAALTLSLAGTAGAVDLRNMDRHDTSIDYTSMTVTEDGQTRHIDLADNEILYGVCTACTIRLANGQEVQATGGDVVEFSGSSLKIAKYPASVRQQAQLPAGSMPSTQEEDAGGIRALPGTDPNTGGSEGGAN
jgi:hypothetical protein